MSATNTSSIATASPNRNLINYNNNSNSKTTKTMADKNEGATTNGILAAATKTVPQPANVTTKSSSTAAEAAAAAATIIKTDPCNFAPFTPSLLSSTSALAKFNRIIDNTVSSTNYYLRKSQDQLQKQPQKPSLLEGSSNSSDILKKRLELFPVVTDSRRSSISISSIYCNSNSNQKQNEQQKQPPQSQPQQQQQQQCSQQLSNNSSVLAYNPKEINSRTIYDNYYDSNYDSYYTNDNQTKRNDVHYLLKQLNSFSDIEEVEIVDRKIKENIKSHQHHDHSISSSSNSSTAYTAAAAFASQESTPSPTPSHKVRNYPLIERNHQAHHYHNHELQQYDDYIFQSCHYLETNCFATTITTAIAGSNSHDFLASSSTTSMQPTSASRSNSCTSGNNIVTQLESNEGIASESAAITGADRSLATYKQSCRGASKSSINSNTSAAVVAINGRGGGSTLPTTISCTIGTTSSAYNSSTIASDVGNKILIHTELSSSLSSSSGKNLSSNGSDERRKPFFKCCYTPLDRWREKRNANTAGATAAAKVALSVGQPVIVVKRSNDSATTIAACSKNMQKGDQV